MEPIYKYTYIAEEQEEEPERGTIILMQTDFAFLGFRGRLFQTFEKRKVCMNTSPSPFPFQILTSKFHQKVMQTRRRLVLIEADFSRLLKKLRKKVCMNASPSPFHFRIPNSKIHQKVMQTPSFYLFWLRADVPRLLKKGRWSSHPSSSCLSSSGFLHLSVDIRYRSILANLIPPRRHVPPLLPPQKENGVVSGSGGIGSHFQKGQGHRKEE